MDEEDGYETKLDSETESSISKIAAAIGTEAFASGNMTIASNDKDATVNTGVFAVSWPYLLAAGLGLVGFFVFRRLSHA
jgi:predicted phage gp36 major capsid-like protein